MKMILVIIPSDHFNKLLDDLDEQHLHGLTVSEARGFGQHDRDFTDVEMAHKLRLEIVCHDEEVETIINAIYKSIHTGSAATARSLCCPLLTPFASRLANVVRLRWGQPRNDFANVISSNLTEKLNKQEVYADSAIFGDAKLKEGALVTVLLYYNRHTGENKGKNGSSRNTIF